MRAAFAPVNNRPARTTLSLTPFAHANIFQFLEDTMRTYDEAMSDELRGEAEEYAREAAEELVAQRDSMAETLATYINRLSLEDKLLLSLTIQKHKDMGGTKTMTYAELYTAVRDALPEDLYFSVNVETARYGGESNTRWQIYSAPVEGSGSGEFYVGKTPEEAWKAFQHRGRPVQSPPDLEDTSAAVNPEDIGF